MVGSVTASSDVSLFHGPRFAADFSFRHEELSPQTYEDIGPGDEGDGGGKDSRKAGPDPRR